jgi:hypothetical protein
MDKAGSKRDYGVESLTAAATHIRGHPKRCGSKVANCNLFSQVYGTTSMGRTSVQTLSPSSELEVGFQPTLEALADSWKPFDRKWTSRRASNLCNEDILQ